MAAVAECLEPRNVLQTVEEVTETKTAIERSESMIAGVEYAINSHIAKWSTCLQRRAEGFLGEKNIKRAEKMMPRFGTIVRIAAGSTPLGVGINMVECATGEDLFTGEQLSKRSRIWSAVEIVTSLRK